MLDVIEHQDTDLCDNPEPDNRSQDGMMLRDVPVIHRSRMTPNSDRIEPQTIVIGADQIIEVTAPDENKA